MTPAKQAKSMGFKSLKQVRDLIGKHSSGHPVVGLQTLDRWSKNKPELFEVVLLGAKVKLDKGVKMDYYICPDIEELSEEDAVGHIQAKDNAEAKCKFKTSGFTHLKVCLVDSEFERVL